MSDLPSQTIRFADLPSRKRTHFKIEPDAAGRAAVAQSLDIPVVRKLRFEGELVPVGKHDWRLSGFLGATVQQPCVVTLEPVTTRIDDEVMRSYLSDIPVTNDAEVEMTEDDTTDPLPAELDLAEVMVEALALALPAYPRATEGDPVKAVYTEPGKTPMQDEDARPFAGLGALRDALENKDNDAD